MYQIRWSPVFRLQGYLHKFWGCGRVQTSGTDGCRCSHTISDAAKPTATESGRVRLSDDFFPGAVASVVIKITVGLASSLNHPSHPAGAVRLPALFKVRL